MAVETVLKNVSTLDLTAFFTMELLKLNRFSLNLRRLSRSNFNWFIMFPTSSFMLLFFFGAENKTRNCSVMFCKSISQCSVMFVLPGLVDVYCLALKLFFRSARNGFKNCYSRSLSVK